MPRDELEKKKAAKPLPPAVKMVRQLRRAEPTREEPGDATFVPEEPEDEDLPF